MSVHSLEKRLRHYRAAYFNATPEVSDLEYDRLEAELRILCPTSSFFEEVGHTVPQKLAVPLPVWMGSLDKRKADDPKALDRWITKSTGETFHLSEKLDGVSLLLYWNGYNYRCYTRGNGKEGVDVTDTLVSALDLPTLGNKTDTSQLIRGEILIPRSALGNLGTTTTNLRSIVNGVITAKEPKPEVLAHVRFLAYSLPISELAPEVQFETLTNWGFRIPRVATITRGDTTLESLRDTLATWKKESPYEIDGIVVSRNKYDAPVPGKNPKHTIAFKATFGEDTAVTTVKEVVWTPSKDGYLKPRIHFEPVHLGGHTVQWATGYNAKYVLESRINTGAQIWIVRSGDVIPKVVSVPKKATAPALPKYNCTWSESGVDLILLDTKGNPQQQATQLQYFLKTVGAKHMSDAGTLAFTQEHVTSTGSHPIDTLLAWNPSDKMGQKQRMSLKKALAKASPECLMAATNCFGRGLGVKRIGLICAATEAPYMLVQPMDDSAKPGAIQRITEIPKFSTTLANQYVEGLEAFYDVLERSPYLASQWESCLEQASHASDASEESATSKTTPLSGWNVVATGKRDKVLLDKLVELGANLTGSVSGKTTMLIYTEDVQHRDKYKKAVEIGIPHIMTPIECNAWIGNNL